MRQECDMEGLFTSTSTIRTNVWISLTLLLNMFPPSPSPLPDPLMSAVKIDYLPHALPLRLGPGRLLVAPAVSRNPQS